jgi:hypothetical protein
MNLRRRFYQPNFHSLRSDLLCLQRIVILFRHYVGLSSQLLTGFMTSLGIFRVE